MKLLTKALIKTIPTLDDTAELDIAELTVYAKFFNPVGAGTWFIVAYDEETDEAFGYVNLNDPQMAELGYINLQELRELSLPLGLGIERDLGFSAMPLQEVINAVQQGRHI